MESISVYDFLTGSFIFHGDDPGEVSPSYFDNFDSEEKKLRCSIVENLALILKSRRGAIPHLPDFGIPDVQELFHEQGSIDALPDLIKETIEKYEPRLIKIRVEKEKRDFFNDEVSSIRIKITAEIKEEPGKELLLTEITSSGWLKVFFQKDEKEMKAKK